MAIKRKRGRKLPPLPLKEHFKEIPTPDILDGFRTLIVKADIKPASEDPNKSHDQNGHEESL